VPVHVFTSTQGFNRPADWNDADNWIYAIGGGAGGQYNSNGGPFGLGGGGGACAISHNITMPSSVTVTIGVGGVPSNAGGYTYFGSLVIAAGGSIPAGGLTANCTYNYTARAGGYGGSVSATSGAGGGAAGGNSSAGGNGGNGDAGATGGNGGSSGTASGGAGGYNTSGGNGNNGTDWSGYGAGAGGGGGAYGSVSAGFGGGHGGFYGGGGGGAGNGFHGSGVPGYGRSGLVVATYTAAVPQVSSVSPSGGSILGGTPVTITGSNFTGATSVTFDGVSATSINVVNSTTITCVTPAHVQGLVNVVVTGPGGTGTGINVYRYGNTPLPARRDIALSSAPPSLSIDITVWYPPTANVGLSSTPPLIYIVPLSPNLNIGSRDAVIDTTPPIVVNTGKRNIEIPQANLFTDWKSVSMVRTVRNPAFDIGADLRLTPTPPLLSVSTNPVPIDIIADDLDEVFVIIAD
jgi:hypothetical protein